VPGNLLVAHPFKEQTDERRLLGREAHRGRNAPPLRGREPEAPSLRSGPRDTLAGMPDSRPGGREIRFGMRVRHSQSYASPGLEHERRGWTAVSMSLARSEVSAILSFAVLPSRTPTQADRAGRQQQTRHARLGDG
jgi:hypothetical protein